MKFSSFLFFAAAAIAAPAADKLDAREVAVAEVKGLEVRSADLETRQQRNTAVGVIASSLGTLDTTVSSNLNSIGKYLPIQLYSGGQRQPKFLS
jgi:hypothetical protein